MPYNPHLNIQITPAQAVALKTALENFKTTLESIGIVTLEPKQVKKLKTIKNKRLPYVQKCVEEFGGQYPDLESKAISNARAKNLLESFMVLRDIESTIKEMEDRVCDLNYNVQNILFNYMRDMYFTSKRYRSDLPGADTVNNYLAELFAKQGNRKNKTEDPNE